MDIYNLSEVTSTMDAGRGVPLHGFNIIGVHGRPLVGFSFETGAEAEAARRANRAGHIHGEAGRAAHLTLSRVASPLGSKNPNSVLAMTSPWRR